MAEPDNGKIPDPLVSASRNDQGEPMETHLTLMAVRNRLLLWYATEFSRAICYCSLTHPTLTDMQLGRELKNE